MAWPLSQDYNEAIQNPSSCFSDPELKQGEAVCNALGLPQPCSGNFADVYAVQAGNRKWAVKCFTRQIPGLQERYVQISKYLQQVSLPFMVDFSFLEKGIQVRGSWYPVLKMQWVEGFALNAFVRDNLDKPQVLQTLCQIWLRLAVRLREANLAHCDLQHGNVLLVPGKTGVVGVRLVDYDGMCVPALEQLKSNELGHANFQHPQRLREGMYGLHLDRFPHLAIYTALRALSIGGKALWEKYDNGDNLLFTQKDFAAPGQSAVFQELVRSSDPEVRKLAVPLMQAAEKPIEQVPLLADSLPKETATKPAAAIPTPTEVEVPKPEMTFAEATDRASTWPSKHQTKPKANRGAVIAGVAVASVLVIGMGVFFALRGDRGHAKAVAEAGKTRTARTASLDTKEDAIPSLPTSTRENPETKPVLKVEPETEQEPKAEAEPKSEPKKAPEPKSEPKPVSSPVDRRLPVPGEDAQSKAAKVIRETFKDDYAKTQSKDRLALAEKLLEQALAQSKEDPTIRFVLFREARDLAASGADISTALKAVDAMAEAFVVDALDSKATVLEAAGKHATTVGAYKAVAENALATIDEALTIADRLDLAGRLVPVAEASARKSQSARLARKAAALNQNIRAYQTESKRAEEAARKLKEAPDDPEANLLMGKYLCYWKGDWDKGLPLLAKGSESPARALAKKEIAKPDKADEQVEIADAWWDQAEKEANLAKDKLRQRAAFWYQQALPDLVGLVRKKAEDRIDAADFPAAKGVDLLKLIDVEKDAVKGKWSFPEKALVSPPGAEDRLQIPYIPPEEYNLTIVLERKQGESCFGIGLVVGGRQCVAMFDSWPQLGFRSGLEAIGGKSVTNNETTYKGQVTKSGKKHEIICSVRKASVMATVDGKPVIRYKGDPKRLSVFRGWDVPNQHVLFLGTYESIVHVTKMELTPISGRGKALDR